jgi:NADH dehydrogenase
VGPGDIGRSLIPRLIERGHIVRALVRPGTERKLAARCIGVAGDALDETTFAGKIPPADRFIQRVGVPHPGPAKAAQFREVDLVSGLASVVAARTDGLTYTGGSAMRA